MIDKNVGITKRNRVSELFRSQIFYSLNRSCVPVLLVSNSELDIQTAAVAANTPTFTTTSVLNSSNGANLVTSS